VSDLQRAQMPTWECYELVGTSEVGRLCFLDGGTPIAYPVSFRLHRTDSTSYIVMRTGPGSLMAKYLGPASFGVDHIDVESGTAWSVLCRGVMHRTDATDQLPVPVPWIAAGDHVWLLLEIATVSGRRFVASDASDGFSVEWQLDTADVGPEP
jgi:nitroimidazol reductase NimA-like FMN-containing flavoprotein (pyridoxamine 5'-phosphate oxidase superfamily)